MATNITPARNSIYVEETQFKAAMSEATIQKIGAVINWFLQYGNQVPQTEVLTSSQTWTVPANVSRVLVWLVGGGGGGSGLTSLTVDDGTTGSISISTSNPLMWSYGTGGVFSNQLVGTTYIGGGAGGFAMKSINVTAGDNYSVTIGAGGTSNSGASGGTGTTGGTTSFDTEFSASGGTGSSISPSAGGSYTFGAGGVGSGGDLNISGGAPSLYEGGVSFFGGKGAYGSGGGCINQPIFQATYNPTGGFNQYNGTQGVCVIQYI